MNKSMLHVLVVALRTALCTLVLTGVCYPLLVTLGAQAFFPARAGGSLVRNERAEIVGSELVAQAFAGPAYLQPRPSMVDYDAGASGGSNLGPTSGKRLERAQATIRMHHLDNPDGAAVPVDLITTSASGLDPHISPEGAKWQAPRIAKARNVALSRVVSVIDVGIESPDWGMLGEARVNVLMVNLALDRLFPRQTPSP